MGQKGVSKRKPSKNKNKIKGQNEPAGATSNVLREAKNQPALIREVDKGTLTSDSGSKKGPRK